MAKYIPIEKSSYYKRSQATPKEQVEKPMIHFYPDVTDEMISSGKYDIPFILSYKDMEQAIAKGEDDIHTCQMVFANPTVAQSYDCYVHYIDAEKETQRIAHIEFNRGQIVIKEWV